MSTREREMSDGPLAVVTGSTMGIGEATAKRLAVEGYRVVVHGRDAERGAAVVEAIAADGGQALFVAADIADRAQAERLIAAAGAEGRIEVLVNNAGKGWSLEADDEIARVEEVTALNYFSAVYCSEAARAVMQRGAIVNIGSIWGNGPGEAGLPAYSAAKAALNNYTRTCALRWAPDVRVNLVSPGAVSGTGHTTSEAAAEYGPMLPLKRLVTPAEIAESVWFCVHNEGINGIVLVADGGSTRYV